MVTLMLTVIVVAIQREGVAWPSTDIDGGRGKVMSGFKIALYQFQHNLHKSKDTHRFFDLFQTFSFNCKPRNNLFYSYKQHI